MAHSTRLEQQTNLEIINQFAIIIRTARLHSTGNTAFVSGIDKFVSLVNNVLSTEKSHTLEVRGEYFFVNEERVRYLHRYILNYDYLIKEFKRAGLGTFTIMDTVRPEDIKVFIESFLKAVMSGTPFDSLLEEVSGITSIELKKLQKVVGHDVDAKQSVKKTYFNTVSTYKNIFQEMKNRKTVNLKSVKRSITSIVNQIIEHEQVLLGLTSIKDYDEYTYYHSANVSIISVALGRRLGMSRQMLIELGIAALFHDIGKIEVPHEILNKPSQLDNSEWQIVMKHPQWGITALLRMRNVDPLTINAAIVAFEHHMNINHSGYPQVLEPAELDLYSRIIIIADQYDALTSGRIYSDPLSPDKALSHLQEKSVDKIDPVLFRVFVNMLGLYPAGTLVMLDTKELGLVFENNDEMLHRPRVMLITNSNGDRVQGHVVDLTEKNQMGEFVRTIEKAMNPIQHKINLAEYYL